MTEESEVPSTNRPTKIFAIIAIIIFVIVLGFILFGIPKKEKSNTLEYNFFTFEEVGGLWQTEIQIKNQPYLAVFRFNPEQVEDVRMEGELSSFRTQPVYITFDPDIENKDDFKYLALASSELSLHLIRALNLTLEGACTKNLTDACINRSIVTCDDQDKSVIYLAANPPPQITLKGHCIILNGEGMDLLKSVDKLLYHWYKIIE